MNNNFTLENQFHIVTTLRSDYFLRTMFSKKSECALGVCSTLVSKFTACKYVNDLFGNLILFEELKISSKLR
jgi:hypothetical protein